MASTSGVLRKSPITEAILNEGTAGERRPAHPSPVWNVRKHWEIRVQQELTPLFSDTTHDAVFENKALTAESAGLRDWRGVSRSERSSFGAEPQRCPKYRTNARGVSVMWALDLGGAGNRRH